MQTGRSQMLGHNFGLLLDLVGKLVNQDLGDFGMQLLTTAFQQAAIGSVLNQGMAKQISRFRWHSLSGDQLVFG